MTPDTLPHWDLTPIFPSLDSPEFANAFDLAMDGITSLASLWERLGIRRRDNAAVDPDFVVAYEESTSALNSLQDQLRTLGSYVHCLTSTDARNEPAQARQSLLTMRSVQLDQLQTRYIAWIGSTDVEALLKHSAVARDHEFSLRRSQVLAAHQMGSDEEDLSSELRPAGLSGWARLHGNMTALLTAVVSHRGEERTLPMSSIRALGSDSDRTLRKAAFDAELKAWESVAVPLAAALNGIKGYQLVVRRRRQWIDDVEPTLTANSIDRTTLEAMQRACVESYPDFRRYMDAKARAFGVDQLAWFDLAAPVGKSARSWPWKDAEKFITTNFGRYSARLRSFAQRSFDERWIDAEPRVGKEGGAYCTGIRPGESRVMMNFDGSFTSVSTLAHELGHGYHNLNLANRTPLQRGTPSTLAETASIFCETIAFDAALETAGSDERLVLLDTALERDLQVVVDIHSRFLFERRVFEGRASRDLTISEFCDLMTAAQRETYGERLDPLHPYMWAVKGHYYGPTFYNYPYTFGLLFGLGLYAQYQREPEGFRQRYDDLLSSTGLADAATLANRFGVDIRTPDFWRSSLDVIRSQIAEFERLIASTGIEENSKRR